MALCVTATTANLNLSAPTVSTQTELIRIGTMFAACVAALLHCVGSKVGYFNSLPSPLLRLRLTGILGTSVIRLQVCTLRAFGDLVPMKVGMAPFTG